MHPPSLKRRCCSFSWATGWLPSLLSTLLLCPGLSEPTGQNLLATPGCPALGPPCSPPPWISRSCELCCAVRCPPPCSPPPWILQPCGPPPPLAAPSCPALGLLAAIPAGGAPRRTPPPPPPPRRRQPSLLGHSPHHSCRASRCACGGPGKHVTESGRRAVQAKQASGRQGRQAGSKGLHGGSSQEARPAAVGLLKGNHAAEGVCRPRRHGSTRQ